MKTHKVLDLHYHDDEGQDCFDGTLQECNEFASTQSPHFMYKVVPMTKEEIENHPDNQFFCLNRKKWETVCDKQCMSCAVEDIRNKHR